MADPAEITFGQLLAGGIGFMLLAGGALLVFLVTYQKRLLGEQLRRHTAEAAHRQGILLAIIDAQEAERERIGRDLHDGVGSSLATAKLLVSRLGQQPAPNPPAELVALIAELVSTAVQDVRGVAHSLYPAVLTHHGLAAALQHLVEVSREAGPLAIDLHVDYPRPLVLAQELALYRICQELIHNALKHAHGASQLTVQLQQQGTRLTLAVADDGCGLPPEAEAPAVTQGAGLHSIAVRVEMLRAHLDRQSVPGQGVRTFVEMEELLYV